MAGKFMKPCIECKWQIKNSCENPKNISYYYDLVTGKKELIFYFSSCYSHRGEGWIACRLLGLCGREGRWFEPKLKENV